MNGDIQKTDPLNCFLLLYLVYKCSTEEFTFINLVNLVTGYKKYKK